MPDGPKTDPRTGQRIDYLKLCFTENLNHARHVENERLTFTALYIAMLIGGVAVIFDTDDAVAAGVLAAALTVLALLSVLLNHRWQGVFDAHQEAAKKAQIQLQKELGIVTEEQPQKDGWQDWQYQFGYSFQRKKSQSILERAESFFGELEDLVTDIFIEKKTKGRTKRLFCYIYYGTLVMMVCLTFYLFTH